jgi:copper chaperone NosL
MMRSLSRRRAVALLIATVAAGCAAPGPAEIHYDSDACDHCRMTISVPGFAAQLVTRTGRIFRFDDPGCLREFVTANRVTAADTHSIWANDHAHAEARVRIEDAWLVVSGGIRAPMNGRMAAFASPDEARALQATVGGRVVRWTDVLAEPRP